VELSEEDKKFLSCKEHIDSNNDMLCDVCKFFLPANDKDFKKNEVTGSVNDKIVNISGYISENSTVVVDEVSKEDTVTLFKKYNVNFEEKDIVETYDISIMDNNNEFQPDDYNREVKVKFSNLSLDSSKNYNFVHFIDEENYEILPVKILNNSEIEFTTSRFSTYALVEGRAALGENDNYNVNGVYYATLKEAIEAITSKGTIIVEKDVTLDSSDATIPWDKEITINTNNKTITKSTTTGSTAIKNNGGKLTITGGGIIQTPDTSTNTITYILHLQGTTNIYDVTIKSYGRTSGAVYNIWGQGESGIVNIDGATIIASSDNSQQLNPVYSNGGTINIIYADIKVNATNGQGVSSYSAANSTINILDGTIESAQNGIGLGGTGVCNLNISGGSIITERTGIVIEKPNKTLNITGGDITATWNGIEYYSASDSYSTITGGTIKSNQTAIVFNGTGELIIGNPDDEVTQLPVIQGRKTAIDTYTLSIDSTIGFEFYDGKLISEEFAYVGKVLTSDTYSVEISSETKDGKTYEVATLAPTINNFIVNGKYYTTLQEALCIIDTTGTVEVNQDVIDNSRAAVFTGRNITLYSDGKTINKTRVLSDFGIVNYGGVLTINGTGTIQTYDDKATILFENYSDATLNITGGTIKSSDTAIRNAGTFKMADNSESVQKDSIIIQGDKIGLNTTGTFIFHDGTIKGKDWSIYQNPTVQVPDGYDILRLKEEEYKTAKLRKIVDPLLMEREPAVDVPEKGYTYYAIGASRSGNTKYTADLIKTIFLVNGNQVPEDSDIEAYWDVSYNNGDYSVIAWVKPNADVSTMYDLYICGKEKIIAPKKSSLLFGMYENCTEIKELSLLDTSNVEQMNSFFREIKASTLDLTKFKTDNVTDMEYMFANCTNLIQLNLNNFNTSNVTDMSIMFWQCEKLTSIDVSNFNTSIVTNMSGIFGGCESLISLNVDNFNTSNVKNMNDMFTDCKSLTTLNVSNFNTSNVEAMKYMFQNCSSLTELDVSNFNTINVTTMEGMFQECKNLKSLNLSRFETKNVKSFYSMFKQCENLKNLDLSNFDTLSATSMGDMFRVCTNLETIILGPKFDKLKGSYMFSRNSALRRIITQKAITSSDAAIELITGTTLSSYPNATLYVPNKESEKFYEQATNYSTEFKHTNDTVEDLHRIRPILEVSGDKIVSVQSGSEYDEEQDAGAIVAGYGNIPEAGESFYGYTLETSGLPVDTKTPNTTQEVIYTLYYKDPTPPSGETVKKEEVMTDKRTIKVEGIPNYSVDGVCYSTLEEAYSVAITGDGVIKVEKEIVEDDSSFTIEEGKTITLDTNGNTIIKKSSSIKNEGSLEIIGNGTITTAEEMDLINNTGTLTVSGLSTLSHTLTTGSYAVINSSGTLTIKDNAIINTNGKYAILFTGAEMNFTGGNITGTTNGIRNNGTGTVNVTGGSINIVGSGDSELYGIHNNSEGTINMTGGTVNVETNSENKVYGIYNKNGTVDVSDDANIVALNKGIGSEASQVGKIVLSTFGIGNNGTGIINITGGTINTDGNNKDLFCGIMVFKGTANISGTAHIISMNSGVGQGRGVGVTEGIVNITGGTIEAKTYGVATQGSGTGTINISGSGTNIIAENAILSSSLSTAEDVITITGGLIKGTINGILNYGEGTIKIGTKEDAVSTEFPVIIGGTNAFYQLKTTPVVEFYDGILKAKDDIFAGGEGVDLKPEMPTGYGLQYGSETIGNEPYNTAVLAVANYSVGKSVYPTLETAYQAAILGDGIITVEAEVVEDDSTFTVEAGKTITLDTNGNTIVKKATSITNKGTLEIIGNGTITTAEEMHLINSSGTLTVSGACTLSQTATTGPYATINGSGSLNVTADAVISSANYSAINQEIENTSTINISAGTISGKIAVIFNGTELNLTGGLLEGTRYGINNIGTGTVNQIAGTIRVTCNGEVDAIGIGNEKGTINVTGGTIEGNANSDTGIYLFGIRDYNGTVNISGTANIVVKNSGEGQARGASTETGIINITGGTIDAKTYATIIISSGKVNISGSTTVIKGQYAVMNGSSTTSEAVTSITGGTVNGRTRGIWNNGAGKVVIGSKEDAVSTASPVIISNGNAYYKTNADSVVEFYDGILKSKGEVFAGAEGITVEPIVPAGYEIFKDTETIDGIPYNTARLEIGWDISADDGVSDVWAFLVEDSENAGQYTLVIRGTGAMKNYADYDDVPWYGNRGNITNLVIEKGVTTVGDRAFGVLSQITSIEFPSTITYIGMYSFNGCTKVTNPITIPKAVTSIGANPFLRIPTTAINVENGNTAYKSENGVLYTADGKELVTYPVGKTDASYTVLDGTEVIGGYACYVMKGTNVELPSSLTEIRGNAFAKSNITSIIIPSSVKKIDGAYFSSSNNYGGAFTDCKDLKTVYIESQTLDELGAGAFVGIADDSVIYTASKTVADMFEGEPLKYTKETTKIYYPPQVTTHPQDVTVTYPNTATFTVTADAGNPTDKNYKWQVSEDGGNTWNDISGATSASYTISNISTNMNGYKYRAVISSSEYPNSVITESEISNLLISNVATLTVNPEKVQVPSSPANKTYNGASQECGISTPENTSVVEGSTTSAITAGTYTVTYKLNDPANYTWSDGTTENKEIKWTIDKYNLSNATIASVANQTYTGEAITPKPAITVPIPEENSTTLTETDITYGYSDNVKAGTATITISAKETSKNYTGSKEITFTIDKADRNSEVIMSDYNYNKVLSTPDITNKDEVNLVTYYYNTEKSNVNGMPWTNVVDAKYLDAGTYYIYAVIGETANYKTQTTEAIEFKVLKSNAVQPKVEDKVYNGHIQVGISESEGIIFTGITEAKDVGKYVVTGKLDSKNYEWEFENTEKVYEWSITPYDISKTDITLVQNSFDYNGNYCEPEVKIIFNNEFELIKDVDFKLSYSNNLNAGEAKVIILGINNFFNECEKTFIINKNTLDKIEIEQTEYLYTGNPIKPIEKVYDADGNILIRDKDYTLYFQNNVEIGTAVIGAIGIGNYKGNVEKTFKIISLPIDYAQVTLKDTGYIFDGEEKCPEVEVVVGGKILVEGRDYEITYENNIDAGENTAIALIKGIGQYKGLIQKNFSIGKADRIPNTTLEKSILLGNTTTLLFNYDGEQAATTVSVKDSNIVKIEDTSVLESNFLNLTGLSVGRTLIEIVVEETQNYKELTMVVAINVFENLEDAIPCGTVIINENDQYTITPKVMLTLEADFAEYMYISESNVTPKIDDEEWYELSYKMPYVFSNDEGEKTIYVWFKDDRGNISKMASDSIILDYEAGVPARDNVLLDQTNIDTTAPEFEKYKQYNDGLDIKLIFKQKDVMVNGIRSGVDHSTIKYGYKSFDNISGDYIWQDSPIIEKLKYNEMYIIVTQASDRAGNGPTMSEPRTIQTERKYDITLTIEDTQVQYNNRVQNIESAKYELVDDIDITGKITYTYYLDKDCTIKTTIKDGSLTEGGAPSKPGTYYVKATLTEDNTYFDTESNVAELRIGWSISKTNDDDVFAYLEKTDPDKDEYILNIVGNGDIADLEKILASNSDESLAYWSEYKEDIVEIKFNNNDDETINSIGAHIFSGLSSISAIEMPDTIIKIGEYAFEGCTGVIENILIPISVEEIGGGAFANVNTPGFEVAYGHTVFDAVDGVLMDAEHKELISYPNGKADETYNIPEGIITIKEAAFAGSVNLTKVIIPNGVEVIEAKAFYDCHRLETVEILDLLDENDNIINLKSVGSMAFENIGTGSIIYTFSEEIAKKFTEDKTHLAKDTEIYWPPVITLQPIDMNGALGVKVKFIVDSKPGNPSDTKYQWFKVTGEVETEILGATQKEYTTPNLTAADDNTYYYCRVYNSEYYFNKGFVNSEKAQITMLDNANYSIERENYNTYLFETLEDAFEFAINDDVIKVIKTVNDEAGATLSDNKTITLNLNSNTINLTGKIGIESKSKLELIGNGTIIKSGDYTIENNGQLTINGGIIINNSTGYGIKSLSNSKLVLLSGNILVDSNAIYAENAEIEINGENANIVATTNKQNANAVELYKDTKFKITNGNIAITPVNATEDTVINAIYLEGTPLATTNITDATISAITTEGIADAVVNAGASDVIIAGDTDITASRSGILTSSNNVYGDIIIRSGKISGGEYGILNNAKEAKVTIGKEGEVVSTSSPIIVGEKVAIFNTKEKNTVEIYDGILYSHGTNVIYEELNNTDLRISSENTDAIYREEGRNYITTEKGYGLSIQENVPYNSSTYKAVILKEIKEPTLSGIFDQTVEVGNTATFEIIASGGEPNYYNYEWEVSVDNGYTWTKVLVGSDMNTNKYTTPITTITMDGYMYRCIVYNEKIRVISKAVMLNVVTNNQLGGQRPTVRINFTDGRVIQYENTASNDIRKYINMQIIVKTFDELETLKLNGERIYERITETVNGEEVSRVVEYEYSDKSLIQIINKIGNNPIMVEKTINGNKKIVEYTYTYNIKVYGNDIITVEAKDIEDRKTTTTQTVDLFYDLKIDHYISELTHTNNNRIITFYANKPVKPISSVVNSYINSTYLDLVSVDDKEFSYRYTLELKDSFPETEFKFEDEYGNQVIDIVEEISRVEYKNVKFNNNTAMIDDLNVIDAYKLAQDIESITEVNGHEEIQSRYGLNGVQSDVFMSRARDVGTINILNNSKQAKSYDGLFTSKIEAKVTTEEPAHDYTDSSENIYVSVTAKESDENVLTKENRRYVDVIMKDLSLYKAINIEGFRIDDSAPYMYYAPTGASNITASTIAKAAFRATIVPK